MKISNREKKLILILVVLIVVFGFYRFIASPIIGQLQETRDDLQIRRLEYNDIMATLESKDRIINEYERLTTDIDSFKYDFFTHIVEEQLVLLIKELSEKTNVEIISLDFSCNVINIKDKVFKGTTLKLNLSGGYLEISDFINLIENYPKEIVISSLSGYKQGNSLVSYLTLEFYSISNITNYREDIYIIKKESSLDNDPFN